MENHITKKKSSTHIVIGKMKFEVINIYPTYISEKTKKEIEHSLYHIFKKYA